MILAGNWKNFDELEESLSLDELMELYNSIIDVEDRHTKTMAAIYGVDLGSTEEKETTFEDVWSRAQERLRAERGGSGNDSPTKMKGVGYRTIG